VRRVYLGVTGQSAPVPRGRALALRLDITGGVYVREVLPGSPAAAAGILPGDLVIALNDGLVRNIDDVHRGLTPVSPGETLTLRVVRGSDVLDLRAAAEEAP
jgi:S1-C subfamily serine protease